MQAEMLKVDTADGAMDLYEAVPTGRPRGAVIVIQEAFGVNDHIQDVTRRFADQGYTAVAPALFHRAGGGTADYTDFAEAMRLFGGLTDAGIINDIDASMAHLASLGFAPSQVAVVGFCFGGRIAFLAGVEREFGAIVSFYPGGLVEQGPLPFPGLFDRTPELKSPWLAMFGAEDTSIPPEHVARLSAELSAVESVDHEVVSYPGVGHAFHCDARPNMYNADAAKDAWGRAIAWLGDHLAS